MNLFKRVELANAVIESYNEGKTLAVIASEFKISIGQAQYILRKAREVGIFVKPTKKGRKISAQALVRRAEIASRYLAGESGPVIARSLGVDTNTVYISLRTLGVERRKRVYTERNRMIVSRYESGESGVKIATDLGVSTKVIYEKLHKAGVIIRKKQVKSNA